MKYITTDKHPHLKENVIFEKEFIAGIENGYYAAGYIRFDPVEIEEQIEKGYIKEILEPRWTDEDMIGIMRCYYQKRKFITDTYFEDYLNEYKKEHEIRND